MKRVLLATLLLTAAATPAAAQSKTASKTAESKTAESKTADTKTEQEQKAAKQVAEKREEAEKKKALTDATALSQIDQSIQSLADRVVEATQAQALAQTALEQVQKTEKAAEASVANLTEEHKKLLEEATKAEAAATEAEKAAKAAEAKAKAEKATAADKAEAEKLSKAAIEARAAATKATQAAAEKKTALETAQTELKTATTAREAAEKKLTELKAKLEDLNKKLSSAQEGRRAQQRWMANRLRPDLPIDELEAFINPLTKEQLTEEASLWIEAVQQKVAAVSATELWMKRNKTAPQKERDQRQETLVLLQDERAKLVDRTRAVLKELTAKGGDAGKIEELEKYLKAVSGLRLRADDARGATIALWSWIKSDEGGVRWGKNLLKFVATLIAFWIGGMIAGGAARRALGASRFSNLLQNSLSGLIRRIVTIVGFVVALSMLEVNINPLLAALGGAAIVVGLALQGTLANFASGMLIMGYRPFDEGDVIEVGGHTGKVHGLSMLSTTIVTADNKTVIIPNGSVWNGTIVNLSAKSTRRVDMVFGIGYDDDIPKAEELLKEIVTGHEKVLSDPPPNIRLSELGDSSVNFIVRPWVKTEDYWSVFWDTHRAVKVRFDAEGVSIPFPQRDVHLHQVPLAPSGAGAEDPITQPPPPTDTTTEEEPEEATA